MKSVEGVSRHIFSIRDGRSAAESLLEFRYMLRFAPEPPLRKEFLDWNFPTRTGRVCTLQQKV